MEHSEINIRVAVCIVTYNQEKYIRQAVESALMQQTTFPVDVFVGNDSSTDCTLSVLTDLQKQYHNILVYSTPRNVGTVRNTIMLFEHIFKAGCYKYVAMLDGDDWWIDNLKLQKQVVFMEEHPNCSFVYTRLCLTHGKKIFSSPQTKYPSGDVFENLMNMAIGNCTILHRISFLQQIDFREIMQQELLSCDYVTNVCMAKHGPVGFIDAETAVWRRGQDTVSAPKQMEKALRYIEHETKQDFFLAQKFPGTMYEKMAAEIPLQRLRKLYNLSIVRKKYSLMQQVLTDPVFPHDEKEWFTHNICTFYIYVYFIKKIKTLIRIVSKYV